MNIMIALLNITIMTTGRRPKASSYLYSYYDTFVGLQFRCMEAYNRWRRGVAVECRTCDHEVAGSSLGRALL